MLGAHDPSGHGRLRGRVEAAAPSRGGGSVLTSGPVALGTPSSAGTDGGIHAYEGSPALLSTVAQAAGLRPGLGPERVLVDAFERLGHGLLDHLRGSFTLALWSEARREGMVVRDPLGSLPLFTCAWGGGVLFASEVVDLLAVLPQRPGPDRLALLDLLADTPHHSERTLFEGIAPLPPAHALLVDTHGWRTWRYWRPTYRPGPQIGLPEAAERLRGAVAKAVADDHRPGARGVLLSGGIDSCTVAAHAAPALAGREPLRAYSLVFPDHPEIDEATGIEQVAEQVGIASTRAAIRDGSPLAFGLRFLDAWALPAVSMNGYAKVPLMRFARDQGVRIMLDGEGGDELFGLSQWLPADYLRRGDARAALAITRRIPGAPSQSASVIVRYVLARLAASSLPVDVLRRLRRPRREWFAPPAPWVLPQVRAEMLDREDPFAWRRLDGPRWWAYLAYALTDLREEVGHRDSLRREHVLAGVDGHHPLLDQDLTEFVLGLPPELAFDPRLDRPLARASVQGRIPDSVRLRTTKSFFDPVLLRFTLSRDLRAYESLLRDPNAELRSHLDVEAACADLFGSGRDGYSRGSEAWLGDLWRIAGAELWLRHQDDPGLPARLADELEPGATRIEWV